MQKNGVQDLSEYISYALSITGPPDFAWRTRDVDIPPDAYGAGRIHAPADRFLRPGPSRRDVEASPDPPMRRRWKNTIRRCSP